MRKKLKKFRDCHMYHLINDENVEVITDLINNRVRLTNATLVAA